MSNSVTEAERMFTDLVIWKAPAMLSNSGQFVTSATVAQIFFAITLK